jgi:hypothetical protein
MQFLGTGKDEIREYLTAEAQRKIEECGAEEEEKPHVWRK